MNALARNLALKMSLDVPEEFGDTFTYNKLYFGKVNEEVVTLERYLEGKFVKHINNTGEIYGEIGDELGMKWKHLCVTCMLLPKSSYWWLTYRVLDFNCVTPKQHHTP